MFDITQLKHIRKNLNLTQNQFAKRAGVSQSLIAKIESKKIDPTYSKVKKIEETLKLIGKQNEKKAKDIMIDKVISVNPSTNVKEIIKILNKYAISQVPVIDNENVKGVIYENSLLEKSTDDDFSLLVAEDVMVEAPPIVSSDTEVSIISSILKYYPLVLVSQSGCISGVITKADLLNSLV